MSRRRGSYYAIGIRPREDGSGRRYAVEPRAPFHTFTAARRWLDEQGLPGYVQHWSDQTQSRSVVANRDADGTWWATNPYNGERVDFP